jgi:uncharacterized protein (TIGR02300 family)
VARPDLGTKRTCPTTGRKFYDLNRDPIVSPYTGEAIPRASFEPVRGAAASRARPVAEEEEADVVPAGPEVISLDDVEAGEEAKAGDDDVTIEDDGAGRDDTFLEDEEEGGDDVADLIDGDIEDDEEA